MIARQNRAVAVAVILPWILAAVAIAFGASIWLRRPGSSDGSTGSGSGSKDVAALRMALASSNAANDALRRELDRLRGSRGTNSRGTGTETGGDAAGADGARGPTPEQVDMGKRLKDALARVSAGDAASKKEAIQAVWDLLKSGSGAGTVLRDAYLATGDTLGKSLVLGAMAFGTSPEARDLIVDQVQSEKDPTLRRVLVSQAARFATPDMAGALESTFVQAIDSPEDPQTKMAAIRGLRYAPGADAPQALMRAAADPSEDVRIAAIDVLLARQPQDPTLLGLIANDSSARVREFAHCEQVVSTELAQGPRRRRN